VSLSSSLFFVPLLNIWFHSRCYTAPPSFSSLPPYSASPPARTRTSPNDCGPLHYRITPLRSTSTSSAASSTSSTILAVSTDGSCGDGTSFICLSSRWGDCCSSKGWCGGDAAYCGTGCQSSFGNCTATSSFPPSSGSSTKSISTDGSCGGSTGFICLVNTFGDCCSEKGYCGGKSSYCAAGCQSDFGLCGSTNETAQISTDGSCGGEAGTTCLGSTFGDCLR
jgi:hypothetical protein